MAESAEYTIRKAKREDMEKVLCLTKQEGWNEVLELMQFQLDYFPEGAVVAESAQGEIISEYS